MEKITYDQYLAMLRNPDVSDAEIMRYSIVRKGDAGAFAPEIAPDPTKVAMTFEDVEAESALKIGNTLARFRRHLRYRRRIDSGEMLPILVSEGDSWFQFPLVIDEVIDQLGRDYLIYDLSAAGDTAANMLLGQTGTKKNEFLKALREEKARVKAFLLSAAGNDVIGEDADGIPVLLHLIKDFQPGADAAAHVNQARLAETLAFLKRCYLKVIAEVRAEPGLERLPIVIHGYDYPFPYPWGAADPRDPSYAAQDEWLGEPLSRRGITDQNLRRGIIMFLLDALYDLMNEIAGDSEVTRVYVVDCRGAMPDVADWNDEIHGTSAGFAKVAVKFREVLARAI
jgi:N-acetylmuramoyl-L-alanine amidase